ncbi:MAG TPA: sigma-70 family RNA polymerase sigma factor [Flavobacterium sp.]|nr:sigma-70 family RNA polymerase sigma factor [Flavobacterium sp.]
MKAQTLYDENELLNSFKSGDRRSIKQLYRLFQPTLLFFANRILFNIEVLDAQTIVQDSFLKLIERKEEFNSLGGIKAFLYTATKNNCIKAIEKEKVRLKRFEKYIAEFDEIEDVIVSQIIYTETIVELHSAIELLPEQCRIIIQKFMDGKTANEISEEMDITVSTVNNQKSRAVSLLRKRLSNAGLSLLTFFI